MKKLSKDEMKMIVGGLEEHQCCYIECLGSQPQHVITCPIGDIFCPDGSPGFCHCENKDFC